jgi:phage tail-like protein
MATRNNPYGAFNFMVTLGDIPPSEDQIAAGFSDVSGLKSEIKFSEYRNGNDKANHVRKIANTNTTGDVTLTRGVIGDERLFNWIKETREGIYRPQTVTITLLDEARQRVCAWILENAQPKSLDGATLAAKGGGEAATEKLILGAEQMHFKSL